MSKHHGLYREQTTLSHREKVASESEPGEGLQSSQRFPDIPYPLTPTPLSMGEGLSADQSLDSAP